MSGKGRLVRKFRHFFAKFWYILEIFAKFCLIKPSFAKFPFIYSIFRLFGITDLLTKSKFWPKHTFAGAPTATFFKILPFFWPPQLFEKKSKSLADPNKPPPANSLLLGPGPRRRFLEFPFGNLGVWRGVEIGKFLEIWGSGEVWKLEIPEIRPSKCLISSPVEI